MTQPCLRLLNEVRGLTVSGIFAALVQGDAHNESSAKVRAHGAEFRPAFTASSRRSGQRALRPGRLRRSLSWACRCACVA